MRHEEPDTAMARADMSVSSRVGKYLVLSNLKYNTKSKEVTGVADGLTSRARALAPM